MSNKITLDCETGHKTPNVTHNPVTLSNEEELRLEIEANKFKRNFIELRGRMRERKIKLTTAVYVVNILPVLLLLPLTIADLYYGYSDDSCVTNSAKPLVITLRDYLTIGGIIGLIKIFLMIILGIFYKLKDFLSLSPSDTISSIAMISFFCCHIFTFAWDIGGCVIFWSYMDNTTCSLPVFNYVFASLIIKWVGHVWIMKLPF